MKRLEYAVRLRMENLELREDLKELEAKNLSLEREVLGKYTNQPRGV